MYESGQPVTFTQVSTGGASTKIARSIHPEPESPKALAELAAAADAYSRAASEFIEARHALNDAKDEWQRCQQLAAGLMDKEGV